MAKLSALPARVALLSADIANPLPTALDYGDSRRESSTARGYGWQWQQLRLVILQRDGYRCQHCKLAGRMTPARHVDHIENRAAWIRAHGSADGLDNPGNLQSLCKDCHDIKTQAEAAAGRA